MGGRHRSIAFRLHRFLARFNGRIIPLAEAEPEVVLRDGQCIERDERSSCDEPTRTAANNGAAIIPVPAPSRSYGFGTIVAPHAEVLERGPAGARLRRPGGDRRAGDDAGEARCRLPPLYDPRRLATRRSCIGRSAPTSASGCFFLAMWSSTTTATA
jgi:hypothetical protein